MKYIEEKDLIKDKYYFVETYEGEYAVLKYWGHGGSVYNALCWGLDQGWGQIRFVFKEVEDLEEAAIIFQ